MSKSKVKVMLVAFFDIQVIVHFEFFPQGQTVNQHVYKEILQRLMRSVRDKRKSQWVTNSWFLNHDNAPPHTAQRNVPTLEVPPYSPDLAPSDFFLFPKLKTVLKGTRFPDLETLKRAVTKELKKFSEMDFQERFEAWHWRMQKCVNCGGDYFEEISF